MGLLARLPLQTAQGVQLGLKIVGMTPVPSRPVPFSTFILTFFVFSDKNEIEQKWNTK